MNEKEHEITITVNDREVILDESMLVSMVKEIMAGMTTNEKEDFITRCVGSKLLQEMC